jgi:hypothetical protein
MGRRLDLQKLLSEIPGVTKAWFQEPPNTGMTYPCILYTLDDIDPTHADNRPYLLQNRYKLTVMDYDPDSSICTAVAALPSCRFDRAYPAENINHFVFTISF